MNTQKHTCCKSVWYSAFRSYVCGKTAKFEVNGYHYCGIHNPNKAPTKAQIQAEEEHQARLKRVKLNSAAPELLEALRDAYKAMEPMHHEPEVSEALDSARAAIAKATGETK